MSAYGKVTYTETDDVARETLNDGFNKASVVDEQVNKFDTSYTVEKLQELYNEYDKITLDEEKIKSVTQIKTNAVSKKVPFRVALVLSTSVIITLLLAFLCIYNISVINSYNSNISYLQEEVTAYEYNLVQAEGLYDRLTNLDNIQNELVEMGYENVASSNIVAVSVPEKTPVVELQGQTNWFDAFCNFLSQIFG